VTRVAAGRLQSHPGGDNIPNLQQAQSIEADQRYLLSKLIYGDIASSEDRGPIDPIGISGRQGLWQSRTGATPTGHAEPRPSAPTGVRRHRPS
jgi:hypothetical protein